MKSMSFPGVILAILAAAAIGVLSTWMLMRQPAPQPTFVLMGGMGGPPPDASPPGVKSPLRVARASGPVPTPAPAPRNSFPRAAAPDVVSVTHEARVEPQPTASLPEPAARPVSVIYQGVNAPVVQQTNPVVVNGGALGARPEEIRRTGGAIDDALSFALEAADPYVKKGFTVREDFWGGDLAVKSTKAIVHQLFRGNEYWFWMGTPVSAAKISVHIYDSEGTLAEVEAWAKPHRAAARVAPKKTGSYYFIVEVEKSPQERTNWALAYGFR